MTSWDEVAAEVPELAAKVRERFEATKHKTMATLRTDGSPRISGTESAFADGELTFGSMAGAVKLADLLRDPRMALHSATSDPPPGAESEWVGEAKVAGRAVATDPVGDGPDGVYFRIDLTEVAFTTVDDGQLVIESWHPGIGYRRRQRT